MDRKKFFIEFLFWAHVPVLLIWFGLFFIPTSLWAGKVSFHFWYVVCIVGLQVLWALLIWRRIDVTCPLTTWMQHLRGHHIKSEKNYDHSFTTEFLQRMRINIKHAVVKVLILITLLIVISQYSWIKVF
jgi:hypothetical protein